MSQLVSYERSGPVATITMDDGKVNAMSPAMLTALHEACDRAEREQAIVVLTGRPGIFSAGFDLKVITGGDARAIRGMLRLGAELALRLLSFPTPVVSACTGNAYPMGAFLMLASDLRIGADGPFKIGLNEVAIGLTIPGFGIELARQRLTPAAFNRCTATGEMLAPSEAVLAGFLDRVVAPDEVRAAADAAAQSLAGINLGAHVGTKLRARAGAIAAIRAAIDEELVDHDTQKA